MVAIFVEKLSRFICQMQLDGRGLSCRWFWDNSYWIWTVFHIQSYPRFTQFVVLAPRLQSISSLNYIYHDANSSPPGQNGRHFTDDIFKCILMNEKNSILNRLSLKFDPKGLINNSPALVQIINCRRSGDKPLSEPMLTQLIHAYIRHYGRWVTSGLADFQSTYIYIIYKNIRYRSKICNQQISAWYCAHF